MVVQQQILKIVGEAVSLVPTGLSASDPVLVEFALYYIPPDMTDEEADTLRKAMTHIFSWEQKEITDTASGEDIETTTQKPIPPCSAQERDLILRSLLYRKNLLQQQLFEMNVFLYPDQLKKKIQSLENQGRLNATLRGRQKIPIKGEPTVLEESLLEHWRRLDKFMREFEESPECVDLEGITDLEGTIDLNDEKVKALLQQFVFFLLQGSHPLPAYTKTDPKAPAFVKRLQKNPIGDQFDPFLTEYKAKQYPIPAAITKVLEATELDPKAMSDEVQRIIKEERKRIFETIYTIIPRTDPFWKTVGDTDDVTVVVDRLYEGIQGISQGQQDIQSRLNAAEETAKACDQAKTALQAEKTRMEAQIKEMEDKIKGLEASDAEKDALLKTLQTEGSTASADLQKRIDELTAESKKCTDERDALKAERDSLTQRVTDLMSQVSSLTTQLADLRRIQTTSIEQLQKDHAAALAEAERRATEYKGAKEAAEASAKDLTDQLTAKTAELASLQMKVDEAGILTRESQERIASLLKEIQDKQDTLAKVQEEFQAKSEEATRVAAELAEAKAKVAEGEEKLANITAMLDEIREAQDDVIADAELQRRSKEKLARDLAAAKLKIDELTRLLKACEESKTALTGTAGATEKELADLRGKLTVAETAKVQAETRSQELDAELKRLKEQLEQETKAKEEAEERARAQESAGKDKDARITQLQGTVSAQQQRADAAEAQAKEAQKRAADAEAARIASIQDAEKQQRDLARELQGQFDAKLQQTKTEYDALLKKQHEDWEAYSLDLASKTADKERDQKDAEIAAQRALYDKVLTVVRQISGEEDTSKLNGIVSEDTPEASALQTIVTRLQEVPGTAASKTGVSVDSTLNSCYLVFLGSFLWGISFPLFVSVPVPEAQKNEKFLHDVTSAVFEGANKPTSWNQLQSARRELTFRAGLYSFLETQLGAEKNVVVRNLLSLLAKLARSLEEKNLQVNDTLKAQEQKMIFDLIRFFSIFLTEFYPVFFKPAKPGKSTPSEDMEQTLRTLAKEALKAQFPNLPSFLYERSIYQAPSRDDPTKYVVRVIDGEAGVLTYPVLFYSFLIVLRDYLNQIKGTVAKTCPVPKILLPRKAP